MSTSYSYPERVQQSVTNTPGTGSFILGAPVVGFTSMAADSTLESVIITEGNTWEVRKDCIYTQNNLTLTRGTLVASSSGGTITFSGACIVAVGLSGSSEALKQTRINSLEGKVSQFYTNKSNFPSPTGVVDVLYVDKSTNIIWVWNGSAYASTPMAVDVNNNFIAQIAPRTGTISNLMGIFNAASGEIARTTDFTAKVLYPTTVGGTPVLEPANKFIGYLWVPLSGNTGITNNGAISLNTTGAIIDPNIASLVTVNTSNIDLSALNTLFTGYLSHVNISGRIHYSSQTDSEGFNRGVKVLIGGAANSLFTNATLTVEARQGASFNGTISGNTLTVTGVFYGNIIIGSVIAGTGVTAGSKITAYGATPGQYTLSAASTVSTATKMTIDSRDTIININENLDMTAPTNFLGFSANHNAVTLMPNISTAGYITISIYSI